MSQLAAAEMTDRGLLEVQEQLKGIESILKAEQKRRVDSNDAIDEYIRKYLEKLQTSLSERVSSQFSQLKASIDGIDSMLGKMERELDFQEQNIRAVVRDRKA